MTTLYDPSQVVGANVLREEVKMLSLSRTRLLIGAALLSAALLPAGTLHGQAGNSKSVSFESFDGVKLSGTLYTSPNPKRDAVVIILHAFDIKKGGSSQQEGWPALAKKLQTDGYHVLAFDFRGFGDSKSVTDRFWTFRHNNDYIKGAPRKPETIDHTMFVQPYLRYLINDVAAAKAYLDRRNDAGVVNSANVILVGAGEGAALGTLWLKNECRRCRDTNVPPMLLATLAQPEINDVACAVWLSIRPNNAIASGYVSAAIREAGGKKHKIPMAFVYGTGDKQASNLSETYFRSIKDKAGLKKDYTGVHPVKGTSLSGNQLLGVNDTASWIVDKYLDPVMSARGNREQKDRKSEASQYFYINPFTGRQIKLSKKAGTEAPDVDLSVPFSAQ
jgi:alpha-beta hydrolase superfamily lysophospholipase